MSVPYLQAKNIRLTGPLKWAITCLALLLAALPAYFQMFFGFSPWDDEGYLLATVKAVVQGHILFDQIYTLYGPFYYLVEWIFYATTGLSPSHDSVRAIALALWIVSAVLLAYYAYRTTASLLTAAFTLVVVVETLIFFQWEPGHPEEICLLLLACFLAVLCTVSNRLSAGKMGALGFLVAGLAQTKINIGLYAALALLLTLLATRSPGRGKKILLASATVASIGFITIIAMPLLHLPWARNYFLLVILSLLPVVVAAFFADSYTAILPRAWWTLLLAFAASWVAIIVPFFIRGTTVPAFLYITIFQHRHFAQHWFRPTPVNAAAVLWSALSMLLSFAYLWRVRRVGQPIAFPLAVSLLKGALGLFTAFQLLLRRVDWPMGYGVMMVVLPFTWLILIPSPGEPDDKRFARIVLAFSAVFVSLYSFPVAGSQNLFAIVPLVVVAGIFVRDAAAVLLAAGSNSRIRRVAWVAASLAIAVSYARDLHHSFREYHLAVPLALPGAAYVHIRQPEAETYQWLTRSLDKDCPSFFSMPGLFSLYFWTRQDSPTLRMMNDWPAFFGPSQQQLVRDDLISHSVSCIVYNPGLVAFLSAGENSSVSPLDQYIHSEFVSVEQRDGYFFMLRKDRVTAAKR